MTTFFPEVKSWRLPVDVLNKAHAEFGFDGAAGNEGIMLWMGRRAEIVEVTHVVALRGPHIYKAPDLLVLAPELLNEVTDEAIRLGITLVGQIHSHPQNFLNLSPTDRDYGISVPGFLSIVAPHYGFIRPSKLSDYGVHTFEQGTGYRRMTTDEICHRISLTAAPAVDLLIVGDENHE